MFKNIILSTPLTKEIANDFFSDKISGDSYEYFSTNSEESGVDVSLISTMRALFYKRATEPIHVKMQTINLYGVAEDISVESRVNDFFNNKGLGIINKTESNKLVIVNVKGPKERTQEVFNELDDGYLSGYEEIEKIAKYFTSFNVRNYVNADNKTSVFFVERLNLQKFHILQVALLSALPWYYNKETLPLSEKELALIESFQDKESSETYMKAIQDIADEMDYKTDYIRNCLTGFAKSFEVQRENELNRKVEELRSRISSIKDDLSETLKRFKDAVTHLDGVRMAIKNGEDDTELADYFCSSNSIEFIGMAGNGGFKFVAKTYLNIWDNTIAENVAKGNDSAIYNHASDNSLVSREDAQIFLNAMFDGIIKIHTWAEFQISGTRGDGIEHSNAITSKELYHNPHIFYHHCIGQNEGQLSEAIVKGDYVFAVNICIASTGCINLNDSTVMSEFSKDLFNSNEWADGKFVELDNGERVTVREAIAYLKERGQVNEQNN